MQEYDFDNIAAKCIIIYVPDTLRTCYVLQDTHACTIKEKNKLYVPEKTLFCMPIFHNFVRLSKRSVGLSQPRLLAPVTLSRPKRSPPIGVWRTMAGGFN